MSAPKLPTLWIAEPIVTDDGRAYGLSSGPFPGKVAYVPASALDAATEALRLERAETARLRLALDAEHRRCVAIVHDVAQKHRKPDGTRTVEGYGALDAWDALASAKPDVFRPRPGAKESADE